MKYLVLQGIQNENGTGDLDLLQGEFTNKKDAIKYAKSIKNDTKGWTKSFNQNYLVTIVIINDEDDIFYDEIQIVYENKIKF